VEVLMKFLIAFSALCFAAAPPTAQTVEVGKVNWDRFPQIRPRPTGINLTEVVGQVETILRTNRCQIEGQTYKRFDFTVPYAVLLDPAGKVSRVVVSSMNCAPIEELVGHVVLAHSDAGDFKPPQGNTTARWYSSSMEFALE